VSIWGPLVARARGLSGHLLSRATLRSLAASADREAFVGALTRIGYLAIPPNAPQPDARTVELAVRRVAARRLAVLERWSRDCGDVLAPLVEDEDRRSLRALVRGALGGVPAEARTAGLLPTAALPARALDELALLNDIGAIGAALIALGHPLARVVADEARRERPDLFSLDQAITRAWATRAHISARAGDDALHRYVERTIDLANLWAARLLAAHRADADPTAVFVAGGQVVRADDLRFAVESASLDALGARLASRVARTPLAAALAPDATRPEDATLAGLIHEFHRRALLEPLGLASVIEYVLRLRAEQRALLRVLWALALGVPAERRAHEAEEAA
jgi:vacuolar-type H+-ATPase subunit C/Vma6